MQTSAISKLINSLLNKGLFLLTGGFVRDIVINNTHPLTCVAPCVYLTPYEVVTHSITYIFDIDIATTLLPNDVATILDMQFPQYKRIRKFATNSIQIDNTKIEITSTRIDTKCNGRHAEMKFGVSYFRDSFRRDFTFNALYMHSNGLIFDFHNGIEDILSKKIRFIGDAKTRIIEDYTRIKRYYNFSKRFNIRNMEIEATIDYIIKNSKNPIIMR